MNKIDRIKNISPDEFRAEYVAKRKPVIIEDATKNWKALEKVLLVLLTLKIVTVKYFKSHTKFLKLLTHK